VAASFLSLLPKSARAAYPIIRRGHREGLSSRAIERRVRQAGLTISRGRSILPIMRALDRLETQGRNVRFVPAQNIVNVKRLPPAITDIQKQYQYRIQVISPQLIAADETLYLHLATNNPVMTPTMIKDEMFDLMREDPERYKLEGAELFIEYGEQRAGIGDFTQTPGGEFLMRGGGSLGIGEILGQGGAGATGTTPTL
jgi:hypothetical protein